MPEKKYDFSGYATKNNLKCSDGRVILKDAFKAQDGLIVPLIWQHFRDDPKNVLGHALLENREDGVYTYGYFNASEEAKAAKELITHGDINALSIYANQLRQNGSNVIHGAIKEVSLVLAGANPGAVIDNIAIEHSDGSGFGISEEEAFIRFNLELEHSEESEDETNTDKTVQEIFDSFTEEEKEVAYYLISQATGEEVEDESDSVEHEDQTTDTNESTKSVQEIFDSMTEEKKQLVYYLIGEAIDKDTEEETSEGVEHSELSKEGGQKLMKTNAFDKNGKQVEKEEGNTLTLCHDDFVEINKEAKACGSYKQAFTNFLEHAAATYGIENIEFLFPEARTLNKEPDFISREMSWVSTFLGGVYKSPFSRIKSIHADITADEARAKGYVKGNKKIEEVFKLLKRTTEPTTIYKKQKLDRDDILDITDLDVVAWMKAEMRVMLNEEIARSALIGDGRAIDNTDKVDEEKIRPIWGDADLYCSSVKLTQSATAKDFIDASIRSKKSYKGTGNPTMFIDTDMLVDIRLLEDGFGHKLYKTDAEICAALGVSKIIEVPVFENAIRTVETKKYTPKGIYLNLNDYKMGADKGGEVSLFDDFDIDYNQFKYLLETRCSGALTKPYSAVAIEQEVVVAAG